MFVLGPRINAAGRIEHGSKAVDLFTCVGSCVGEELARSINDTNNQRRDLDLGTTGEAIEMLENDELSSSKNHRSF